MTDPINTGIYEIVNLVNGKRYVGSAVDLYQRWREHRWGLAGGRHHSRHLQAAWRKYGADAFEFRVLMECPPVGLLREEQAEFDRRAPEYNVCPTAGSSLGRQHSEETRLKIGATKVGLKMPPRSAEHRAKLSAGNKGKLKSPEHMAALQAGRGRQEFTDERRATVSAALKASYENGTRSRERPPEYREKIAAKLRGRPLSAEHCAKVSAAMKGKKRGPYNLDPAKAEARKASGKKQATLLNERRWGHRA